LAAYRDQKFFESTRGRIVTLIRRASRTVEELAQELDLTDNGVRAHLAVLERDGLVRQRGSVRRGGSGGGKPAYVYELTPQAEDLFPKAYEPVLHRLLDVLGEQAGEENFEALLRAGGVRLAEEQHDGPARTTNQRDDPPACALEKFLVPIRRQYLPSVCRSTRYHNKQFV